MAGIKDTAKLLLVEDTRAKEISSKEINETSEISRGSEAVAEIRAEVDKLAEKVKNLSIAIFCILFPSVECDYQVFIIVL